MTETDFDFIRRLLHERAAIVLDPGKEYLVEARLLPLIRRENLGSVGDLVQRLRGSPSDGLHVEVLEAMTTNETSFFRDGHPFDALRTAILPQILARKTERVLNIWSAACACGQEPYSVAMMLREHFPELAGWTVRIIASDLSGEMISRASAGLYNQIEVNRGLPAPLLVKYFRRAGAEWRIADEIRRAVEFRRINLAIPWPALPEMDVILLRNVLIYFDIETRKAVLRRVARLLRPDGFLLMGGAETTMNLDDSFERVAVGRSGFYRLVR
jgi:chemotaxis protein methyltransferase CheR